ncbi:MAG TPA: O-antigen ligase family protein [Anaerolineae bacterium]|nr:O-antigen ligase family protein [Anaerolineae bacterium]
MASRLLRVSRAAALIAIVVLAWPVAIPLPLPNFDVASLPLPYLTPTISLPEVIALAAIVTYALAGWPNRATLRSGWRRVFVLSLAGLIVFEAISIAWSPHQGLAIVQVLHVVIWAAFAVMMMCAEWSPVSMTAALLIGLVLHSVVGFAELTVLPMVSIVPQYSGISVVFSGTEHWLRVYGISSHPNVLGGYLAVGILLILGLIISAHGWRRWGLIVAWLLCWLTLLLTFSRSAWLGVTGGGLVAFMLLRRGGYLARSMIKWLAALAVTGLGLTVAFVWRFQSFLVNRIEVEIVPYEARAITQRLDAARLAVKVFSAHPLTGVGIAQSIIVTRDLLGAPIDWIHNVPLLIAAELGVVGVFLIGLMLIALVAIGVQRWRWRSITLWQALVGGALIALVIAMQFDHYVWTVPQGGLLWAWLVGWWLRRDQTTAS